MYLKLLISLLIFTTVNCFPSIPGSLENAIVLRRLTKLYTLRSNAKLSELCEKQSKIYNKAFSNGTGWALEMMDASSKLQAGIAGWNPADLGNFDQCLAIDSAINNIKGKYCYTRIKFTQSTGVMSLKMLDWQNTKQHLLRNIIMVQPKDMSDMMSLRWSFCVPDGCSASDVKAHLNKFFLDNENGTLFNVQDNDCQTLESLPKLTSGDWTAIGFFIAIGIIIILSTIYDVFLYYTKKEVYHPLTIAFSWFTNFRKFIKVNNNPDQLPCLNGIRFISMLWIIHGHQLASSLIRVVFNLKDAMAWTNTFWAMTTLNSTISVDTFFFLSGCLLMYGFLKAQAKNIPFNVPFMYIHRYLRLTPMYAVTIIFTVSLFVHMNSGPTWQSFSIKTEIPNCKNYWWSALLYIQNFVNPNEICVAQSWYLQIDMQLFIVSPLILYSITKYPKLAPYIFGILIAIFTAIPTGIAWYYNLDPIMSSGHPKEYYENTFARAGPWIIGLLLGYILFHTKQKNYKINMSVGTVLWIVSLPAMFYIIFANYFARKNQYYNNQIYDILFVGFNRNLWVTFIGMIVFACIQGYGGPVNWFLSLPMFQILSRLTYSMYLTHLILIQCLGPQRTPIYFSNLSMLLAWMGTVGLDLIISLICLLTFEAPFAVIDNILINALSQLAKKKSKTKEIKETTEPKIEP